MASLSQPPCWLQALHRQHEGDFQNHRPREEAFSYCKYPPRPVPIQGKWQRPFLYIGFVFLS